MDAEVAISLKNVSKCYKRYAHPVNRLKEILRPQKSYAQEFWALRDINVEIYKGETIGIIGQNGSGKSTLLQIIAGTLTPTTGEVRVNGRVSALLELGSGFNPEFTGRQNVFFNGQILGLSKEEIENKFDGIAAFADIGDFIDQPVKSYSSGMFVRLAFAVVVSVNPDILIVDEALAVGDIFFQQKCFERIRELKSLGTTILFVSHDTTSVYRLCSKAVLMESGKSVLYASSRQVIDLYEAKLLKKLDTQPDAVEIKVPSKPDLTETQEAVSSPDLTETQEAVSYSNNVVKEVIIAPEVYETKLLKKTDTQPDAVEIKVLSKPDLTETQEAVSYSNNVGEEVLINSPEVSIQFVKLLDESNQEVQSVISDQLVRLCIGVLFLQSFDDPHIGFQIRDRTGFVVFQTHTFCMGQKIERVAMGTLLETCFEFYVPLMEGEYTITVGVADSGYGQWQLERSLFFAHNMTVLRVLKNKDAILWWGMVNLDPSISFQKHAPCRIP